MQHVMSGQVGYKGRKYIWGESWKRNDKFEYATVCNSSGEIYMEELTRALPGNVRTLCALLNLKSRQSTYRPGQDAKATCQFRVTGDAL